MHDSAGIYVLFQILTEIVIFTSQAPAFGNIRSVAEFFRTRQQFVRREKWSQIGGNIQLNAKETLVNNILMGMKRREIDLAFYTSEPFPPAIHFFEAKPQIDRSDVFQIIRTMPKGGNLHIHDVGLTNLNWVIRDVTYRNNPLFMCIDRNNTVRFGYFVDYNPPFDPDCPWNLLRSERARFQNVDEFDMMLKRSLSLIVQNPIQVFPTTNSVWDVLTNLISNTANLIALRSVFEDYLYQGFTEYLADNIQYIELRSTLPEIFDRSGRQYSQAEVLQIIRDVAERFTRNNPSFIGVKLILTGIKTFNNNRVLQDVQNSIQFRRQFPTFFAGYDLIFDEDRAPPLSDVVETLLYPRTLNPPVDLPYFLHAAETNWHGLTADKNLIDAILLNTTRIGHGFTINKHPLVKDLMRKCGKPVEMNPISHQTLRLVEDQRDHPAATLIAEGFPLVIGCDASPMWDALPLSHDYYIVFMGYTAADDDIRVLKQLFLNSIIFSAMDNSEKQRALLMWERSWDIFLDRTIQTYLARR